jgi:hypothetical protein
LPVECPFIFNGFFRNQWLNIFKSKLSTHDEEFIISLLKLQGIEIREQDKINEEMIAEAEGILNQSKKIAAPVEVLLTEGGDDRLKIDKKKGLNDYGCSPRPRPWAVTFASTTASSISEYAFGEAEVMRQKMIESICDQSLDEFFAIEYDKIRKDIIKVLDLCEIQGLELALASSGTDCELLALYLAVCHGSKNLTNILLDTDETGSGVLLAASGKHFMEKTPLGKKVERGAHISGMRTEKIRLVEVPLRNNNGLFIEPMEVNSRIITLIRKLITSGDRVLLHVIDSSKTGLVAPNMETIFQLKKEYGDAIDVVVDACQFRTGKSRIKEYLEQDFMVAITGSKFYTGPPFSAAILIPEVLANRVANYKELPKGFFDYFTTYDVPKRWIKEATDLSRKINLGLMLRWRAALWEINAFQAVSEKHKYLILALFGESIREAIYNNPDLELLQIPSTYRWKLPDGMEWDWLPTIFTFLIYRGGRHGSRKPCSFEEARMIYQWLNNDISNLIPQEAPEEDIKLAAKRYHIGQPVKINETKGEWTGALRISCGARLVSGVRFDPGLGRHFAERLSKEITDACESLDKISLIVKYFNYIHHFSQKKEPQFDSDKPFLN